MRKLISVLIVGLVILVRVGFIAKEIGDNNFKAKEIADNDTNIKLGTYYLSKSVKDGLKETVGNWAIRNGEEKNDKFDAKEYAKQYFTKKIELREKIYKI